MVSWTGISSSRVTRCTAVRGEAMTAITDFAWLWIGPIRAIPATSELTLRNRVIRPVGGASITTASNTGLPSLVRLTASMALPVSRTSRTPGAIVVAKSMAPMRDSAEPARRRL